MRGFILTAAICALSTAALADPQVGHRLVAPSAIVCDTRDQVMDLFNGTKIDDGKGIIPKYLQYNEKKDDQGEPTCNLQPIVGPPIKSVQDLGDTKTYSGDVVHGWLIEIIGDGGKSGWVLYGEEHKGEVAI
jgi:hypothetical protein